MNSLRRSRILSIPLLILWLLAPLASLASQATPPAELSANTVKDRASYDRALSELSEFMHEHKQVDSYEDIVDALIVYKDKVSRQEMGETLYNMYSLVGPAPSKKYYGDKGEVALEAAAKAAAQKAQQDAAAAAAAKAQSAAQQAAPQPKTYVNSSGNTVQSPTYNSSVPAGATAQCRDGSYSFSQHHSGTCSYHGGVATWLQ